MSYLRTAILLAGLTALFMGAGYLVGGPWPGPKDWFDVQDDYRTNEVAINWNGALIYALAAFVEPKTFDASINAFRNTDSANSTTGQ